MTINGGRWPFSMEGCAWAPFPSILQRRARQRLLLNEYRGACKQATDDTKSRCNAPPPIGPSYERGLALRRRRGGMPSWKTGADAQSSVVFAQRADHVPNSGLVDECPGGAPRWPRAPATSTFRGRTVRVSRNACLAAQSEFKVAWRFCWQQEMPCWRHASGPAVGC
jgi:hypothetical protein